MPVPLVPVKALAEAKGRLAPWLNPIERRLLAIAMLEDVVAALQAVAGLERPVVISPDREVWRRAEAMHCRVVEEEQGATPPEEAPPEEGPDEEAPSGLNRSLSRAAAGLEAPGGLLVVAADLPLASASSIQRVIEASAGAAVVVVPSRDGAGTNVLAWRDPASFAPAFGPDSAARHLDVPGAVRLDDPRLALDVDTLEDLRAAAAQVDPASVTGRRLRDMHLAERLQQVG
jgi:2-phospho-L-lactate/phosphoenolpyruvate guanylyltransferase